MHAIQLLLLGRIAHTWCINCAPIATDGIAWSVCLCLLVTFMSPAKRAKLIEIRDGDDRLGWAY